jgi:vacuolar-type H+-ATPase subunit H
MDALVATLKTLEAADLFKVMKQALAEAEKRTKGSVPKGKAATTAKKAGSMPKGVVPPQLKKPRAWVDFTHAHALENGWESFTVYQSKKNKVTGEKEDEEIEMPASVLHDGAHVYDGSVTEKNPTGKQLIHKDAMSLSKQRWAPKDKSGTHEELYAEFLESYVEDVVEVSDSASVASSKKVTKVTAAEKAAAAELKKAEKEAEKEAKKAEKEAEKEAKKAEKEAEKEAKKAEKEAEKAAKKAEKDAAKKPTTKSPVPAAAVKKAASVTATPIAARGSVKAAATPVKAPVKKAPVAAKTEEWTCPSDGMVHPWPYKGKSYLRNSDNEVWLKAADGGCGEWQGVYLPSDDSIDDSVAEPVFDDE